MYLKSDFGTSNFNRSNGKVNHYSIWNSALVTVSTEESESTILIDWLTSLNHEIDQDRQPLALTVSDGYFYNPTKVYCNFTFFQDGIVNFICRRTVQLRFDGVPPLSIIERFRPRPKLFRQFEKRRNFARSRFLIAVLTRFRFLFATFAKVRFAAIWRRVGNTKGKRTRWSGVISGEWRWWRWTGSITEIVIWAVDFNGFTIEFGNHFVTHGCWFHRLMLHFSSFLVPEDRCFFRVYGCHKYSKVVNCKNYYLRFCLLMAD